mgnify:FL=1
MNLSVAVVGAGPSGFYAADAMLKAFSGSQIDIIDQWPIPFGLVRFGVAPDHLSTKNVTKLYEKILDKPGVRFVGNVELGRDISYEELKSLFDVVILAFGMEKPRLLDIPGADLAGVISVTDFVGWYNATPESKDCGELVSRARSAIVVGNGNVALDIVRLLAKTEAELATTDIVPAAANAIVRAPLNDIYVVGRRGPIESSFSFPELSELGDLVEAQTLVDSAYLPADASSAEESVRKKKERNLRVFRTFAGNSADNRPVRIHLMFYASPIEIIGQDQITTVKMSRNTVVEGRAVATNETFMIDADLLVPTIGYELASIEGLPTLGGVVKNQDGRVEPGVYVVGWARRGPTGVIGTNRVDAREVVALISRDAPTASKPGPSSLDDVLSARSVSAVDATDWRQIDAAEIASGGSGRPRVKFTTVDEMLRVTKTKVSA